MTSPRPDTRRPQPPARAVPLGRALSLAALIAAAITVAWWTTDPPPVRAQETPTAASDAGCLTCHQGIEEMHPFAPVTCVQCHGGDATATTKEEAHVPSRTRLPGDERVLGRNFDPDYLRFRDPGNLRIAHQSCGPCHVKAVSDVMHSLHASTSGHLGDGLYENGVVSKRHPPVSIFPMKDETADERDLPKGAVAALKQIDGFAMGGAKDRVSRHFTDLPRKACMNCHLWTDGRAVRGRAGMDGDYRGEGCTACHVPYTDDGLTLGRDPTIDRYEPGHPREHRMVRYPETAACVRCHYGDASIGLSFRGLAQPVPGMPQTPDAPGLHRKRLNGTYYIEDPAATPADVHHQRGMHCVDCHTRNDVMGDGSIYKRMEDAVEIRCETCHGTPERYTTGKTRRGTRLQHLIQKDDGFFLRSRVTGKLHRVKQARDVVRPGSADYSEKAALAMTEDHWRLECYACHSGWNPNFFGFHFDRNEAFTQLDILSGKRTAGRVSTQEKVFSTFKHFYLGWNSHGRIAPYMVGFSSMATAHDEQGELLLDQALPVTSAGLSGMTMIHHQTHTTTARARQCVECHRAPSTFGRGTVNFRLMRDFFATGGADGVRLFSLDRKTPANTSQLAALPVADVRSIAYRLGRVTGHGEYIYALSSSEGIVVCDVSSPGFPHVSERVKAKLVDPQQIIVRGTKAYIADGGNGIHVVDVSRPARPRMIGHVANIPAQDLHLDGTLLHVAAGTRGIAVLDVSNPEEPRTLLQAFDLNGADTAPLTARRIEILFQYSRPNPDELEGERSAPRNLAAVATEQQGLWLVDVTEPRAPVPLSRYPAQGGSVRVDDVALGTIYELGSEGGAIPSRERDYVAISGQGNLALLDVTDPRQPVVRGSVGLGGQVTALRFARVYNPPFLQTLVVATTANGVRIVDVTDPTKLELVAQVAAAQGALDVRLEEFPLDRTVDADGAPIMDVSHEGARWLSQKELLRVIGVPRLWGWNEK